MKRHTQRVLTGLAMLMTCILLSGELSAVPRAAGFGTHEENDVPHSPVEARDLPIEQYMRFKTAALSNAKAQRSLKISNPRVSTVGFDPAVLAILDEQERYLRMSDHTKLKSASMLRTANAVSAPFLCRTPLIATVNGRAIGAVFTPRLGQNHYRIEGCGFGSVPGEVQLVPDSSAGLSAHPITLLPEDRSSWSDRQIDVRLDPRLAGIPDLPVTLVVQLADARRLQLSECRFLAVRGQPVALKTIPASWVKLSAGGGDHPLPQVEYVSPPTGDQEIPRSAANTSAVIIRSDGDKLDGGTDSYEFSGLNAGWTVDSVEIHNYSSACPGDVTRLSNSGRWNATFNELRFSVQWASTTCSSFIPPTFRFSMASSEYAVTVWVTGPIGTEPIRNASTSLTQRPE